MSQTEYKIILRVKPLIDKYVFSFALLAVGSSIAIAFVQTSSINNFYIIVLENFLRILGGAAGGGALTKIVLNYTSRARTTNSYKAINRRLIMLSRQIYIDILGKPYQDPIFQRLSLRASSLIDCSDDIQEIRGLLKDKVGQLEGNGKSQTCPDFHNYDQTRRYVADLTNIYYQNAYNNTTNENILNRLEQCRSNGLQLLKVLEGEFLESARLRMLDLFLECNLELHKILLGELP